MTIEQWRRLRERVKAADRDAEPQVLAPAEAFDDRLADDAFRRRFHPNHDPKRTGRHSRAVEGRLASSCASWREKPDSVEFNDALHAKEPTRRQAEIIDVWLQEAEREEMIVAWAEGAYSWRMLAAAIHRAGLTRSPRCADINTLLP